MDTATTTATADPSTDDNAAAPIGTASYDPEDNKLRLRPFARLPRDLYERVKAAGFSWAPRQELFVAPMWTPDRADLLAELCGEIGDEDTSLVDRTADRADRFAGYSDKRLDDAQRARAAVAAIADGIPFGQPILVGHHSERKARRVADQIHAGMGRAVKMWETSEYWTRRAAGAIAAAKYKERPDVRHRRIKGLEADVRKFTKQIERAELLTNLWRSEKLTLEIATAIANRDHVGGCKGIWSLWDELDGGKCTMEEARDHAIRVHAAAIAHARRWLDHTNFRLEYERAMLGEGGGLVADRFNVEVGGRVLVWDRWCVIKKINRANGRINSLSVIGHHMRTCGIEEVKDYRAPEAGDADKVKAASQLGPIVNYPGEGFDHMTKAEWDRIVKWQTGYPHRIAGNETHGPYRLRQHYKSVAGGLRSVYVTDLKETPIPPPDGGQKAAARADLAPDPVPRAPRPVKAPDPVAEDFKQLKAAVKAGVTPVVVPQLFVTPPELAADVVGFADVEGRTVLEPEAGLGALALEAVRQGAAVVRCIDNAAACVSALQAAGLEVTAGDFLTMLPRAGLPKVERIVMNPPFADGADVAHVTHAYREWLAPGGRLVAIMSAGVKFREDKKTAAFRALVKDCGGLIEDLPDASFKSSGTFVRTVIVTLTKGQ